ncbi:MAG: TRAP transporter substrate-binding protein [Burkholderiales bacterium]|nr:TRAP transporter substrate-binding protein [Burkholderiales bacterium]
MFDELLKKRASGPVASRRRFLSGSVAATAAAATWMSAPAGVRAQTAGGQTVMRWQSAWSAKDIFYEYVLDYAKKVHDLAGGRLRIEVLPAGAVVKAPDLLDAVAKGMLDGGHGVAAHWHARNSAFSLFGAGPALGMDGNGLLAWMEYGGGKDLYSELLHKVMHLNVAGFLYGPMPTRPLGWFRKPVTSAAQLKGLKFGVTGPAADLFREMGAAVSELPEAEITAALGGNALGAVESSNASNDRMLGLPDAAQTCMLQSYHQPAEVFAVLWNRKKYEALPADLKNVLAVAMQAASADMSWKAMHRHSQDYVEMRDKRGVRFPATPAEILRAQMRAWNAVIASRTRENPFYRKVLDSQMAWARRTVGWSINTLVDPRIAYDHWFGAKAAPAQKKK